MLELSEEQRKAVEYVDGPSLVTAGAGSGKTRTLTAKIAHLVNRLGHDPARILAITFTNKAAGEMKSRLRAVTGRPAEAFPWVRTFHSACFQILKEHCEVLGYQKPLTIHSEYQQKTNLKRVLGRLDLDPKLLNPMRAAISRAKNSENPWHALDHSFRVPRKREAYELYNELLVQQNAVDFDDILMLTRDLLRNYGEVREICRGLFDYILIDEFQDSNAIQNEIVDLLLRDGRLTVVGDDYQSIYRFRGADPVHFIRFPEKFPGAAVFRLEENYRSTEAIVKAAEALIAHNRYRIEKTCFSRRSGPPVAVRGFTGEDLEAAWVADCCWQYHLYEKIPLDQMAVLYRTRFCSLAFERAFRSSGIPYQLMGGRGFFERREVQDINAYLVASVNPRDDASFERIVNVPRRGIGSGTLQKIMGYKAGPLSMQEACRLAFEDGVLPKKTAKELGRLLHLLESLGRERPDRAIRRILEETGYVEYLEAFAENERDAGERLENIEQMVHAASQKQTIAEYLENCALLREDQDDADDGHGVRLSTFHAAKGLEYRVVFVAGVEEGLLPHWRSVTVGTGQEGGALENEAGIEEERRLLYVAMTRASERLHLSWCRTRRGELVSPSRFLDELPEGLIVREDL